MFSIFKILGLFISFFNLYYTYNIVYPNLVFNKYNNVISRKDFLTKSIPLFSIYNFNFINNLNKNILIIGCKHIGIDIIKQIKLLYPNIYITVTTTKPKRVPYLQTIANNVIIIPQLATSNNDLEFIESIKNSDTIIISDIISIFSPHSFLRTAIRIRHNIDLLKNKWKGNIFMISSENAYGSVLNGNILDESTYIYPNIHNNNNNNSIWHVNSYGLASIIRSAEQIISNGPQKVVIFRTAGIWNTERFRNAVLYTKNHEFPSCIKNSFITFTTTLCIAKAILWCIDKKNIYGIFNLADIHNKKLTRNTFYSKLYYLYSNNTNDKIKWNDNLPFNFDTLYSLDPDPYTPISQRSNSILSCNKIYKLGFKK